MTNSKTVKALFIDCDEMALSNRKFSKTGKYYSRSIIDKEQKIDDFGLRVRGRYWCMECKLYHKKKDMYIEDMCKECYKDLLKDGFHFCKGCKRVILTADKQSKEDFCIACRGIILTKE